MAYTSRQEKREALEHINQFVNTGNDISIQRYQRLVSWLNGMALWEIAASENVSQQAVAQSVRRDFKTLQQFVKDNYKH